MEWNSTEKLEFPCTSWDEDTPVWAVVDKQVVALWYQNPEMDEYWFEDDNGNAVEATLWIGKTSEKPEYISVSNISDTLYIKAADILTSPNPLPNLQKFFEEKEVTLIKTKDGSNLSDIVIGQEVICPDGLGRVVAIGKAIAGSCGIKVDTFVNNRGCFWASHNVELIINYRN